MITTIRRPLRTRIVDTLTTYAIAALIYPVVLWVGYGSKRGAR